MPAAMSAIDGPALDGSSGGAGDREEAGLALDEQVVGLLVAVGAVGAVAGDVADDDLRLHRGQPVEPEAEAGGRAGRQVLHHDVGLVQHQPFQRLGAVGVLDVQRHALLGAVGPDEVRGQPADPGVVAAGEVAGAGTLDLDHAGAEVGELAGGERRGDGVLEGDDGEAGERLHGHAPSRRRVAVASMVRKPSWSWAQSCTLAVATGLAVDPERVQVERRAHRPEPERRHLRVGSVAAHQVQQQRGEQRAVHDQPRVALDLGHVAAVVVDPVPVEGQRRVAEQQHVVGHDLALPRRPGRRGVRRRLDLVRAALGRGRRCRGTRPAPGRAAPLLRTSWRTVTNTSGPVRPTLLATSSIVDVRTISSPTRIGLRNSNRPPAHIRRGSSTGGRKPPRRAWPSGPISDCWCTGRK